MVLKQRFAEGRTNYIDIGSKWTYTQKFSKHFETHIEEYFTNVKNAKDCIGLIEYGEKEIEPIYEGFPQWIYSDDGKLFMTLV